jgi:general secretion pathway protein D
MPMPNLASRFLVLAVGTLVMMAAGAQNEPPAAAPKGANAPLSAAQQTTSPRAAPQAPVAPQAPAAQRAAAAPALKPNEVLLNFQNADIQGVVKAVSQMTKRNFLLDPRVKGQITIISAKPVSRGAAYQIFLSALKAQGFTAVEGFGVTKIVPAAEAKTNAYVSTTDEPGGGEQIATHVLIMQHGSATQMIPLLRPLMSPTSQLAAYDAANALIITDYADNIRRMIRIVAKLDQPTSSDVTIVPITHASALDLADLVMRLSTTTGQPVAPGTPAAAAAAADRFTIVPDLRTNSLLIRAENPGRVNQLRSLIAKLDVPAVSGGHTRVIYLRNADAVKLSEVLRGILQGEARAQQTVASVGAGTAGAAAIAAARATGARTVEASLIQADEATNAIIINAPDAVYNNLRAVIEKLDVRRAQVFIEALIVEMTTDTARELGIQWAAAGAAGQGAVAGVQNFPSANPSLVGLATNATVALGLSGGLTLGYLGKEILLPDGTSVRSIGGLAKALEQQNLANILSTPNLMTLDNAEAKIVVGQNVPFVTGSYAQAASTTPGAAVNPFQTIERKDVGLTLKVKPQVSEGGNIKMDIYQEVSNLVRTPLSGASDLITSKRSIETKVVVDDGSTIVLGGLIEETSQDNEQGIPFLSKIPLLGVLFRYKDGTTKKTNLMVFLRPQILRSPTDNYRVSQDRYDYLRTQSKTFDGADVTKRLAPQVPKEQPKSNEKPTGDASEATPQAPTGDAPAEQPAEDEQPMSDAREAMPQAPNGDVPATEQPAPNP